MTATAPQSIDAAGTAVQTAGPTAVQTSVRAVGLLRPIAAPADVLAAQNETRAMVKEALQDGRDFGVVPGTDKPSLLKPGAERVALAFGCYYGTPEILEREIDHDREVTWAKRKKIWRNQFKGDREYTWQEEAGASLGLYRYVLRVPVINRASGEIVGAGIGACSTMESKYIDRPRDSENTVLKMAHKRAVVGAALITFGLSDEFTQDAEDLAANGVIDTSDPAAHEPKPECPKCKGKMWDDRLTKRSPKAPDFKCKDKACDGVIWPGQWPPKPAEGEQGADPTISGATSNGNTPPTNTRPAPASTSTPTHGDSAASATASSSPTKATSERITVHTPWPNGKHKGTLIKDLPPDFLVWATEDGRKFGEHTAALQDACRLQLEDLSQQAADDAAAQDDDDSPPF